MKIEIEVPDKLHADTVKLVKDFASAMAKKLRQAEIKHGYGNGWKDDYTRGRCACDLLEHLQKGDPIDVANYCAFMWFHGWKPSVNSTITI